MTFEARFDLNDLDWTHMEGGPEFDYLVDFDLAVLGAQPENNKRSTCWCASPPTPTATSTATWPPPAPWCSKASTTCSTLIPTAKPSTRSSRPALTARAPEERFTWSGAVPEGAIVLFNLHSPTGVLFESLDADHNVIASSTIESMSENPSLGG